MAAGLGFKTFTTGEVLTAADTNGYLMQGVLVFASAAARDAAITSPQEGQCCYLKDTDAVQTYSGSAWVGFDDSNAIQNSIVDAKGDIVAASGNDTPARLAVGNNGDTLVADSAAATGLNYTPTGLSNPVVNGGMDIWQRGTSFTVGNTVYLMDRWFNTGDTNLTVTRDTDVPTNPYFNYSAKLVGTGTQSISQKIESANSARLAGQVVTISLYAKKTSGTGALNINIYYPSATDNFASLTQIGSALQMSSNPGSSWTRYSVTTSALPADVQKGLMVLIDNTNTHTIFITGVQIDVGSVALPFRRAGGTIQGELALAQRYYYRQTGPQTLSMLSNAGWGSNNAAYVYAIFNTPVSMRSAPTSLDYGNVRFGDGTSFFAPTSMVITTNFAGNNLNLIEINYTAGGLVQYRPYWITCNTNAAGFLGVSAEL